MSAWRMNKAGKMEQYEPTAEDRAQDRAELKEFFEAEDRVEAEKKAEKQAEDESGFTALVAEYNKSKWWYPVADAEFKAHWEPAKTKREARLTTLIADTEGPALREALRTATKQLDRVKAANWAALFRGDAKAKAEVAALEKIYQDAKEKVFAHDTAFKAAHPAPAPELEAETEQKGVEYLSPYNTIPLELRIKQPRWGVYQLVLNEAKKKYDKIPYNARTQRMGEFFSDESGVFFFDAIKLYLSDTKKYSGIGYGFNEKESAGVIGIDLDNCINPQTREIASWAREICDSLDSYTEISVSNRGLHILVKAAMPKGPNGEARQGIHTGGSPVEIYSGGRFFALTGNAVRGYPDFTTEQLECKQLALNKLVARVDRREFDAFTAKLAVKQTTAGTVTAEAPGAPPVSVPASREGSAFPITNSRGPVTTNRITLLTEGKIACEDKAVSIFRVQDDLGNEVTFPSHSEADGSLCLSLAIHHIGEGLDGEELAAAIRQDFGKSVLFRDEKGGRKRPEYLTRDTIPSAIERAKAIAERMKPTASAPSKTIVNTPATGEYTAEMEEEERRQAEKRYTESILFTDEPLPETEEEAQMQLALRPKITVYPPQDGAPYFDKKSIFYGIAGHIIEKIDAESESHPAGNLLEFLIGYGSMIGQGPYYLWESTRHYTNEYCLRVGESSLSKKGTGKARVEELLDQMDHGWFENCRKSGFGSGQAVIQAITDEIKKKVKNKQTGLWEENITLENVKDKRMLISQEEFSGVLKVAAQDNSLYSEIFREAFDCKKLENNVKGEPCRCRNPFISCACDTNPEDLNALLRDTPNAGNGFGNRFMYAFVAQTKEISQGGGKLDWSVELYKPENSKQSELFPWHSLSALVAYGKTRKEEVKRSQKAVLAWERMKHSFPIRVRGMHRSAATLIKRGPAHVARLALIYALLDESPMIEPRHLYAAKALWDYCCDSAEWIFSGRTADLYLIMDRLDSREVDKVAQTAAQIQNAVFRPGHSQHPRPVEYVESCLHYLWKRRYLNRLESEKGVYWTRKNAKHVWKLGGVT